MTTNLRKLLAGLGAVALSATLTGCGGQMVRDGRSPVRLVINSLRGASGAEPDEMATVMHSDVVTMVRTGGGCSDSSPCRTIFTDPGSVELSLLLRDPGDPVSPNSPSGVNAITVTRYHVEYRRADGRNVQGVDVPYAFDGAATFTVSGTSSTVGAFTMVRSVSKSEAPLSALQFNETLITTIAYVTFYGHDQAGNDVSVTGTIEVMFGNFGDPA